MRLRIMGVGSLSRFSGVNEYLYSAFAKRHNIVDVVETTLSGFWKYWNILYCFLRVPSASKYFHPIRTILSDEVSYYRMRTKYYILKRTELCECKIRRAIDEFDVILQTSWPPAIRSKPSKPYYIYQDFTREMVKRMYPPFARFYTEVDKNRYYKLEMETYHNATGLFTFSNQMKNSLIEDYDVEPEKIIKVLVGVNLKKMPAYKKRYDKKNILFVADRSTFELKGGNTLLRAFKEVKKEVKDVQLHIVGTVLNIEDRGIIAEGPKEHPQLLNYYKDASILAMPSIMGGFQTILEAMAYKCPCVGGSSTCSEIIEEGKTGFLVPPNDYKELANKIILLLEDENLMKKMGESGRDRVERYFTWDKVVDRMTEHFEKTF